MSVLAIGDLLFSDLLSELNIKPWWEKFRGYCFAASVASALFMTYIILLSPTTINCTPLIRKNVSSKIEFSTTQAFFINNYCSHQIPWYVNHAGIIPLVCTFFILAASIWWLHNPKVIAAFRTFAIFSEDIEKLKLTSKQLGNYCSKISELDVPENTRALQNFRNTCNLLWKYESSIDVDRCYFKRNVGLLCTTMLSAGASFYLSVILCQVDNNLKCSLDTNDEYKIYGTNKTMRLHFCSYNTSKRLVPFMTFSTLSILAQVFFVLIFILKIRKTYCNKLNVKLNTLSAKASKAYQYSLFMLKFRENARPGGCEPLRNDIECMFIHALWDMLDQMENAILKNDNEMVSLYSCVKNNGGNDIIKVMKKIVERKDLTTSLYVSTVNACDHLDSIEWGDDIENFIDELFKRKYWRIFVHCLFVKVWTGFESSSEKTKAKTYIENLNINTDEIGESHLDSHRPSILHYVIKDKLRYFQMAPQYEDHEYLKKYVHFDGKSEPISIVLKKHCYSETPELEREVPFPVKIFFECTGCSESRSQKAIKSLFDKHKIKTERLENLPDQEKYIEYQKKVAEKLSRLKFPEWDYDTKKLAEFLHSKKQWVVFVELLNAFIAPPMTNEPPVSRTIASDCGVNSFTLTDLDADGASILYYALDKPFYLWQNQKKIREFKFQFTAIRYIWKFTEGQEKIVIYPNINKEISAEKYVDSLANMDRQQINELLRILEESTARFPIPEYQSDADENTPGPSRSGIFPQEVLPQEDDSFLPPS